VDIGAEAHVVAVGDEEGRTVLTPTSIAEAAQGYARLLEPVGDSAEALVVMEATGHSWRNLFATLAARGFAIALVNPLRTQRFAEEELRRTQTDAIDARGLAHFGRQKRPQPTRLPDRATEELRELVHLRERQPGDAGADDRDADGLGSRGAAWRGMGQARATIAQGRREGASPRPRVLPVRPGAGPRPGMLGPGARPWGARERRVAI
jgi:transposase